ncbi:MAG TPA: phosphoribosylpyrophosphate synthetase [Salinimicrobium sp.]|nr:phosphoribosylpyrophosphate synthetase [Salinimicrobium sp.]
MKDYGTLSQALQKLRDEEGYVHDFNLEDAELALTKTKEKFKPQEFVIDKVLRFEGFSNPDDNSILFAVTTSTGRKGTLVDGYGVYSGQISKEMIEKLYREKP